MINQQGPAELGSPLFFENIFGIKYKNLKYSYLQKIIHT
jgi:hypothetical protein